MGILIIIIIGICAGLFLGVYMLVYGIFDIITADILTFRQLFWDIIIISFREVLAAIVFYVCYIIGLVLMD